MGGRRVAHVAPGAAARPSWRRRFLLVLLLVLVAEIAWVAVRGALAAQELERARDLLADVPDAIIDRRLDDARTDLEDAGRATEQARDLTGDPVWRLLAAVPVAGDTAASVRGLAVAADELTREALPRALRAAEQIEPDKVRRPDGAVDIALLRAATPDVVASADAVERALRRIDRLPSRAVSPVADARVELRERVAEAASAARGAADALQIAPALLGEDRPRRYFLMVQQPAESRGTGGLVGGFAVIEAAKGRIRPVAQGSSEQLLQGRVEPAPGTPEDYLRRYEPLGVFGDRRQVNLSPDLPVVGRQVAERWRVQTGQAVDGVVALDAVALSHMLRGSGPLLLGGRSVAPSDLVGYLSLGQYEGREVTREDQLARKDELTDVAGAAVARITGGQGDTVELVRGLADALRSGHLRMTSDDEALRPTLARTGLDGALPAGDQPLAYLVLNNASGGKLDQFLDRSVTYRAGPCADGRRASRITVDLISRPPQDLPPYVTLRLVDRQVTSSRTNLVGVSVYGTMGARLVSASLDGQAVSPIVGETPMRVDLGQEAGLPVWQAYVEIEPDEKRTLVLDIDEPVRPGQPLLPRQPLLSKFFSQVTTENGARGLRSLSGCAD